MSLDPKATYYDAGGIEVIKVVKAKLPPYEFRGYLLGTALVYLLRAHYKGELVRDVEKAKIYLDLLHEDLDHDLALMPEAMPPAEARTVEEASLAFKETVDAANADRLRQTRKEYQRILRDAGFRDVE